MPRAATIAWQAARPVAAWSISQGRSPDCRDSAAFQSTENFMKHILLRLATLMLLGFGSLALSAPIDDSHALQGVKQGKGVFLIDFADPKKTAFYLDIIKGTHDGMLQQGVQPDFVIVYIGPTVRFLTTAPEDELALEHEDSLKSIARHVKELADMGVRHEVCAVATRVFKVNNATILPGMHLVGDGFISLIGWQTQGYKLVPLF
jgi:intracellular sulfur oxidation DsrE/DsrF family protein